MRSGRRSWDGWLAAALVTTAVATPPRLASAASCVDGAGVLAMLAEREANLERQLGTARAAARDRARRIYRLSRVTSYDVAAASESSLQRARVLGLGAVALKRDVDEARLIEAELERVRAERRLLSVRTERGAARDDSGQRPPTFSAPTAGPRTTTFGVGRDAGTGLLVFSPGVRFRAAPRGEVRAIADGTVRRVTVEDGTFVVVVAHAGGWTSITSGLGSTAVQPGAGARRGEPLGTAPSQGDAVIELELWRGPMPVDPAAVLKPQG